MAKLLHNERVKLYKKPSTWVLSGILVALMLFSVVFVKIISLVSESSRYDVMDWQEVYQQDLASMQMALENNPGDPYMRAQIQWYEYLLDKEIPPGDWRNDPSYSYFTALVAEEDAEAALEAAPGIRRWRSRPPGTGRKPLITKRCSNRRTGRAICTCRLSG